MSRPAAVRVGGSRVGSACRPAHRAWSGPLLAALLAAAGLLPGPASPLEPHGVPEPEASGSALRPDDPARLEVSRTPAPPLGLDGAAASRRSPLASRDPRLLALAEVVGVQTIMMAWDAQVGRAPWADVTPTSVGRNLGSAWVMDDNPYFVNQGGHPYQGTYAYTAARSAGLGFWSSAAYPFIASAAWELAGETERPSINDQITTTVGGVVLGEILYRLSDWARGDGRGAGKTIMATLLSPMTSLNRAMGVGGAQEHPVAARLELQVGGLVAPGAVAASQGRVLTQAAPLLGVRLRSGIPGSPDWSFERPFDHFDLAVVVAPSDQTYLSIGARGVAVGAELGGPGEPGAALWGLWLGFDLESPGVRRYSTSTVGLGLTGRRLLGQGLELDGTAIGSAVLLGAAGVVDKPADSDRDYRFGPGAQSLLALGLDVGDRLRVTVEGRHVLIFAVDAQGGRDQLLDGRVSGQVRIFGASALRVEASRFLRLASESDGSSRSQGGLLLAVSWVYGEALGHSPGVPALGAL